MRSRRAARSTRLVLAAVAVTALASTATACGPDDAVGAGSSATPSAGGGSDESRSKESPSRGSDSSGSDSGGSTDKSSSGTSDDNKSGYGQSCGTNDLDFTLSSESQAGGYYLVTAKAKSGITCYLDVNTPSASFGSGVDGVASPVGQGGEDPIKLTGSAVAYTGINPKTTSDNAGAEFESVIVALTEDDPNPAELQLPEPANVDKPIVTNWSTNRSETVPLIP
ncbi:hypothetical protein [Streptomyces sp. NBC_01304]|uniref:hypothetical protein n=1 Tax=Streptomyces sp. NBC_01304 TaxID=2903818 RepID=UPI002E10C623|nr:hypothetical protein OG430_01555 [Streptomyces sp. NBC_01304]